MQENKFLKGSGSGWFEDKNPVTNKAPVHAKVAAKTAYNKNFGSKRVSINPKRNAILHFSIVDEDIDKFTDLALVQFRKEYGVIDITISRDEKNLTVVEIPRENAIQFHDFILSKNKIFGSTDIDLLIELREDGFSKHSGNEFQGIDTRLRTLR